MTTDTRYNGWTNYETWRVNLEMFGGWEFYSDDQITAEYLQELAHDILEVGGTHDSTALSFAQAFIADVNWQEIADHKNEERGD